MKKYAFFCPEMFPEGLIWIEPLRKRGSMSFSHTEFIGGLFYKQQMNSRRTYVAQVLEYTTVVVQEVKER